MAPHRCCAGGDDWRGRIVAAPPCVRYPVLPHRRDARRARPAKRASMELIAVALVILLLLVGCAACTPQQALISALIPDGTASVLLGHLQGVEDGNRRRIVELEQRGDWQGLAAFADSNIGRDPFSPEWRMIGGYAHARLGENSRAATKTC